MENKRWIFTLAALAALTIPAAASRLVTVPSSQGRSNISSGTISPSQARSNIGQCITVEGRTAIHGDDLRPGIDVDMGSDNFTFLGFIPNENLPEFPMLGSYEGKTVDITGVIQWYRGHAEIKMTSKQQLRLQLVPVGNSPHALLRC